MTLLLHIAAAVALVRAVGLLGFPTVVLGALCGQPVACVLANGAGLANIGFAFLFWRTAIDPRRERAGLYTALLVTGLRAAASTYEVLYQLQGDAAVVALIDMIASLALFVGMVNALPGTLRGRQG